MSRPDAERALEIYQNFTKQTDYVVQYLAVARQWEPHTRVEVPKLKHAPINLRRQLEEYLKDPDFEIHRRQYLAELDAKKKGGAGLSSKTDKGADSKAAGAKTKGASSSSQPLPQISRGPDPDLIDFFDSIEQNQTTMAVQPTPQAQMGQINQQMPTGNPFPSNGGFGLQQTGQIQGNGFLPQPTGYQPNNGPFQQQNVGAFSQQQQMPNQIQPNFTGAGFGGYTPQQYPQGGLPSMPQDSLAPFQAGTLAPPMQTGMQTGLQPSQQTTNPFRASMMMANQTGALNNSFSPQNAPQTPSGGLSRQNTNPFARASPQAGTPFSNPPSSSPFPSAPPIPTQPAPLQSAVTGTNPFARNFGQQQNQAQPQAQRPQTSSGLMPQPTGSTNPFRQGAFVNHQTGMGWQHAQQPIGGGLDQIETMPVFPRPATQTPWQQ